jgi:CxxC-x17-CxxC domain-containing protein
VSFTDKTLTCRDCGSQFTFTAGEQEFYAQKGFDNEPTRCQTCRRARKAQRNEASGGDSAYASSSGGYGRDNYSSGRDNYSSGGGGGYGRSERVQHETVCSNCGRQTTVPFVPRGDRPVYCADCFRQQRASSGGYNRSGYNDRY